MTAMLPLPHGGGVGRGGGSGTTCRLIPPPPLTPPPPGGETPVRPIMTSPDLPSGATGVIVIDLAQIGANWRTLADRVHPAQCAAVVKADAYGLGAARVIPALWNAGCRAFFVATPDEAGAAAALVPNTSIFALDGLVSGSAKVLDRVGAIPVLSSLEEVREWSAYARMHNRRLPAALHVDSGLNRLGLSDAEVQTLSMDGGLLAPLDLRLIMSHLASADDPSDPKNEAQRIAFERQCARLPKAPASLAASDGLMLGPPYHYDLVRPGYALYGGQAFKGGQTPVRPAVSVAARVLQVRDVAVGGIGWLLGDVEGQPPITDRRGCGRICGRRRTCAQQLERRCRRLRRHWQAASPPSSGASPWIS